MWWCWVQPHLDFPVGHSWNMKFYLCVTLSWIPIDSNEKRFMPICSSKFLWGLHKVTWSEIKLFFLSITKDNSPTVSALLIDSNLYYSFKLKLLLERKSSQNQTAERIPGYLAWLLVSAWSAHCFQDRHLKVFEGKQSCMLAERDCNRHCTVCLKPLFH